MTIPRRGNGLPFHCFTQWEEPMTNSSSAHSAQLRPPYGRLSGRKRSAASIVPVAVAVGALFLAGCVASVKLRHPKTGQEVTCGPYAFAFGTGVDNLNRCLDDFQRQGYERAPD
jgi:hypothetical protein